MKMRYLDTGTHDAYYNMALDEILMESPLPVLRTYEWSPPAVSLGYFQKVQEEVDEDACLSMGINVIRRQTGGGAVFHDKELTYSVILREFPQNILESYRQICDCVIKGLGTLGINAQFAPLNDIIVDGKKVSGCAQTRRDGVLLQHGTMILGLDVERMFSVLRVPSEKMRGKLIQDIKARVGAVGISYPEMAKAIKRGFEMGMGANLEPDVIGSDENMKAKALAEEKYRSTSWLYRI